MLDLQRSEELKESGALEAFEFNSHYDSGFFSLKSRNGLRDYEIVARELTGEFMSEEEAKTLEELKKTIEALEEAEDNEDEDKADELDEKATELATTLANAFTDIFQSYDNPMQWEAFRTIVLESIEDGANWLGDLETEDGEIVETIRHK